MKKSFHNAALCGLTRQKRDAAANCSGGGLAVSMPHRLIARFGVRFDKAAALTLAAVTMCAVALPLQAQTKKAPQTKAATQKTSNGKATSAAGKMPIGVHVTSDYVLGTGDVVVINSTTHQEVGLPSAQVPPDGKINVPLLGQFEATGKTIAELQSDIQKRMVRDGFLRPAVTVVLNSQRPQRVFLLNTDGTSGTADITPGMRISDVLALAGGTGQMRPELTDASLSRLGIARPIPLDLPSVLRDSNSKANIEVKNGDTIRLMPRIVEITVAGSVTKPGTLKIPIGSSLTEVMALAGGPTEKAALSRSTIKRADDGTIIPVNLNDVLIKGQPAPDIELREGDLLLVPEAQEKVTVQGAVGSPGYFPIEDGRTLRISELIALAGGLRTDAYQSHVTVQHADGTSTNVDLYRVLALNDARSNIELKPDDIVTVPAYTEKLTVAGTGVRAGAVLPIEEGKTMRLLEALTAAGGVIGEPEGVSITVTRGLPGSVPSTIPLAQQPAPKFLTVDPVRLYKENDIEANIPLQNGDQIIVTALPRNVFLSGHVKVPGTKILKPDMGLVELLTDAGGILETGLASGVIIERDGKKHTVDVFDAVTSGETMNFPLQPGDNIIVPENRNRVAVMPGVNRPGYIVIPEDKPISLAEAMVMAGGPSDVSKLDDVALLRPSPNGGGMEKIDTPLKNDKQWIAASKVMLQPGDIVYVPSREPYKPRLSQRILGMMPFVGIASRLFGFGF
jgi:polysaccharide export outer membrane protein